MALSFMSPEWNAALCGAINGSAAYREEAARWDHGPVALGVTNAAGMTRFLVLDVEHGQCRGVGVADAPPDGVAFTLTGTGAAWENLLENRLSPAAEIARRNLIFRGNWVLLAKYQDAARTLIDLTAELGTDFSAVV